LQRENSPEKPFPEEITPVFNLQGVLKYPMNETEESPREDNRYTGIGTPMRTPPEPIMLKHKET
jgi:hypothetical protein